MQKICEYCGKEYNAQRKSQKCCSRECSDKYRKGKNSVHIKCDICGKEIVLTKNAFKKSIHHYCSVVCMGKGETKFRSGKNNANYRGSKVETTCDVCGKTYIQTKTELNKYKHHYCSIECKCKGQTIFYSGENSKLYNKNLSDKDRGRNYNKYVNWRRDVYEKDNYTCQCCGDKKSYLNAHHLDGYNWCKEKRTDVDNGVTLCEKCHNDFHSKYGKGDNTKEQYEQWIITKTYEIWKGIV